MDDRPCKSALTLVTNVTLKSSDVCAAFRYMFPQLQSEMFAGKNKISLPLCFFSFLSTSISLSFGWTRVPWDLANWLPHTFTCPAYVSPLPDFWWPLVPTPLVPPSQCCHCTTSPGFPWLSEFVWPSHCIHAFGLNCYNDVSGTG